MRDGVELTTEQLGHAIAHARLGDPHPVVAAVPGERGAEQKRAAWAEFVRLGLVSRSGALLPEFIDVLAMLVRPETECSAWIAGAPGGDVADVAVLGARTGDAAVLAKRTGERVLVRPTDPATVIERVVRELPSFPDGTGSRIAVRQDDFSSVREGRADTEVGVLRAIVGQPRWGCAQLSVARRRRKRLRVQRPLTVLDTKGAGRWCTYLDEPWIVAAPGRRSLLVDTLSAWEEEIVSSH